MKKTGWVYFGKEIVKFEIPEKWYLSAIAQPNDAPVVEDEEAEIRRAINNPIGGERIPDFARPGKTAAIITDDKNRPHTPTKKIVPILLEELNNAGVRDEDITIVLASGVHVPHTPEEKEQKYGRKVVSRVKVISHKCDEPSEHVNIGTTSRGYSAWINKTVVDADIKIGVGTIMPSPAFGMKGGAKIIVPGVASRETIYYNHFLSIQQEKPYRKWIGLADGSPAREDAEEVARILGVDMLVNAVLDRRHQIVRIVAGDIVKAHREGTKVYYSTNKVAVPRISDVVITSDIPGKISFMGHGSYCTELADLVTKHGGTIITSARSLIGIEKGIFGVQKIVQTPEELQELFDKRDPSILHNFESIMSLNTNWGILVMKQEKDLIYVSERSLARSSLSELGLKWAKSIPDAIEIAKEKHGEVDLTVIPEGGQMIPFIPPT